MCPQTSYSIDIPAVSYPGQIADSMEGGDVLSALAVASPMPYGVLGVVDGANSGGFDKLAVKLPSTALMITALGSVMGIVLADQARAQNPAFSVPTYPQNSAIPLARRKRVWVLSETAVADGAQAFARFAANGPLTQLGAIRADADGGNAAAIPGAVFRGAYAAPGYVCIEMNSV